MAVSQQLRVVPSTAMLMLFPLAEIALPSVSLAEPSVRLPTKADMLEAVVRSVVYTGALIANFARHS